MTTRQTIITRALALLRAGVLASNLPGRLMAEFGLSPGQARKLAGAAIRRWKSDKGVRQ